MLYPNSVPCRGTTFLNTICAISYGTITGIPSPVGELHFSMMMDFSWNAEVYSVPCRGTTFLNEALEDLTRQQTCIPSPVGELHFSIGDCKIYACGRSKVFRPLSGNYISQSKYYTVKKDDGGPFRPLSGNYISQSYHGRFHKGRP